MTWQMLCSVFLASLPCVREVSTSGLSRSLCKDLVSSKSRDESEEERKKAKKKKKSP